jgi:hypothetical protein
MGRESRQSRRARERRDLERRRQHKQVAQSTNVTKYVIFGGIGVVVAAIIVFAGVAFSQSSQQSAVPTIPVPTAIPARTIAGIQCNPNEQLTYHVHSHLVMVDRGKMLHIPANIGIDFNSGCYYWLHSHQPSNDVIHVESPTPMTPKLKQFFQIWGEPISSKEVYTMKVQSGEQMKVYVNQKPYHGNPANILLQPHTNIYIEVGPPFVKPQPFAWGNL